MTEATSRFPEVKRLTQELLQTLNEELTLTDFLPFRDRVLVKPMEKSSTRKEGDIYVHERTKNKTRYQLVLRVGNNVDADVEPGDVVITGRRVGHPYKMMGEDVRFIKDQDLMGVLED